MEKTNTFEEMEKQNKASSNEVVGKTAEGPITQSGEIKINNFSNTAVGEQIKYNRPDLDGKIDIIDKFQVMEIDTVNDKKHKTKSGEVEYIMHTAILTYASKNEDDVQNREYISGIRAFVQKDGSASEPKFWYHQPIQSKKSQNIVIWELVAKKLGIEPDKMTPRQYMAFMNGRPKVRIAAVEYENYNAPAGSPPTIKKNMPVEFL